jgi:adenosine kinase
MTGGNYELFCIGNPLLDMSTSNGEALLKKYNLEANNAILAGQEHAGLYDEIKEASDVKYVAGGAAQNAARGAAVSAHANKNIYQFDMISPICATSGSVSASTLA